MWNIDYIALIVFMAVIAFFIAAFMAFIAFIGAMLLPLIARIWSTRSIL